MATTTDPRTDALAAQERAIAHDALATDAAWSDDYGRAAREFAAARDAYRDAARAWSLASAVATRGEDGVYYANVATWAEGRAGAADSDAAWARAEHLLDLAEASR